MHRENKTHANVSSATKKSAQPWTAGPKSPVPRAERLRHVAISFLVQFKANYDKLVAERAAMGIVPKPLDAQQCADLVKLFEAPPAGEEEFMIDLISNRVPPGVDEAAYVKAGFLSAIALGKAKSPIMDAKL
jgi:hypothetical protein